MHEDVIELFTFTEDQAFAFLLLATKFDETRSGWSKDYEQLRLSVQGDPGTGKSQVIIGFLWYAFQCRCSKKVAALSFTWRSCDEISNAEFQAMSTSTFLCINSVTGNTLRSDRVSLQRLQSNLCGKKLIIIDEESFNFLFP